MNRTEYYAKHIALLTNPKTPGYCSFNNHIAKIYGYSLIDAHPSNDITVINWQNKNGSNAYQVRYVFDFDKLYVSGDLGEAIFQWYGNRLDPLRFPIKPLSYLREKMKCTSEVDHIDDDVFKTDFEEWKQQYVNSGFDFADCVDEINDIKMESCNDASRYANLVWNNSLIEDFLDCYEAIDLVAKFGRVYPVRFLYWFEGLRMAQKQLRGEH
jgi:hypothetical protein